MRRAGADAVFAPYAITGHRLAQSLLRPHVVQFLDFTTKDVGEDIAMEQARVSGSSDRVPNTIKERKWGKGGGMVFRPIGGKRGEVVSTPPADTAVQGGD